VEAPRQSRVVAAAAGAGLPVSAVVGARFAFEPGRGLQSLPVRPALLGSIVGVAGALAALTFSAGVDDATRNLERFGVVHDLELFIGLDGTDYFPADDMLAAVASVDGVAGVNDTRSEVADTGNGQLAVLSVDPVGDPLAFVVTEGRLPYADGEVTIGPASARSLGLAVGDTIELTGTTGTAMVTVVGIGLMPQLAHNSTPMAGWSLRAPTTGSSTDSASGPASSSWHQARTPSPSCLPSSRPPPRCRAARSRP
jgi:hypothetical protein